MKKKSQIIIFILLVTTLIVLNRVFISVDNSEITQPTDMVDHDKVSSQKLSTPQPSIHKSTRKDKESEE